MRILAIATACLVPTIASAGVWVTKAEATKFSNQGGTIAQVSKVDPTQRFILFASAIPVDGRVAVCGYYAISPSAKPNNKKVKRQFSDWNFYLGSYDLKTSGRKFNQVPARFYKDGYVKTYEQQLKCSKTRVKWEDGFEKLKVSAKRG